MEKVIKLLMMNRLKIFIISEKMLLSDCGKYIHFIIITLILTLSLKFCETSYYISQLSY